MSLPSLVHQYGAPPPKRQVEIGTVSASLALQTQDWPLGVASNLLQPYFLRDRQNPDLADFIESGTVECHCTPDLMQVKAYTPFGISPKSLPPALLPFLASNPSVGFVELGKNGTIWVCHGSDTYLWNLENDSVRKFGNEAVYSMEIMPADRNVFSDTVSEILVVSFKDSISLFAIDKQNKLFDTGLSISIAGLGKPTVRTTPEGRVFFVCENTGTALFEFRYSAREGWFAPKTKRVCHGELGGFLGGIFGTHTVSKDAEHVRDFVLDSSVHAIYILTSRSSVHVYDYTPKGTLVSLVENFSTYRMFQGIRNTKYVPADKELVSICAVPLSSSKRVRFVVLTATGARIYFRAANNISGINVHGLQHAAAPIPKTEEHPAHNQPQAQPGIIHPATTDLKNGTNISGTSNSNSKSSPGLKALAHSRILRGLVTHTITEGNTVLSSVVDMDRVAHQHDIGQPLSFVELSGFYKIDGKVLLLCQGSTSGFDLILTPTSLYQVRTRPFSERFEYADISLAVAQVYGPMQTCCGSLSVASHSTSRYSRENAIASYFRFGGLPMFKRDQVQTGFLNDGSIRLSALFDGLALYLARLLLPVWNTKILRDNDLPPVTENLDKLYEELVSIVTFLDRNRSFSEGLSDRNGYTNTDDAAVLSQAEYKGLHCLGRLAKSCQEGVAFIRLVLNKSDAKQVLSYFDKSRLLRFGAMTFGELFTVAKESDIVKELVNSLVNFVLNQGESLDTIAATIQTSCPTYCSSSEVLEYKALEFIHQAKEQKEPDMTCLTKSATLVRQAAASIQIDTLKDIVRDYAQLRFYTGAVQSALAVAAEQDPANLAVGYLRQRDSDSHTIKELEAKRRNVQTFNVETKVAENYALPVSTQRTIENTQSEGEIKFKAKSQIYDVIFNEILKPHPELADAQTKDATRQVMLDSPDEVWHFALYDWYLNNNRQDQVAMLDTPFIANYLLIGSARDIRIANLLWKWYQRHGDLLATADVLLDLARGPLSTTLTQRVEFLSRAMAYCQAQTQNSPQATNMATMVKAYLGLARIQTRIQAKCDDPRLNQRIFTVTEQFYDFAKPLELYDVCFELIEFADLRDPVVIESCWQNMFAKERRDDGAEGSPHFAQLISIITSMGIKFGNCKAIFNPTKLVPMIEQYAVEYTKTAPTGWIVDAFQAAGVELSDLNEVYVNTLKNRVLSGEAVVHAEESLSYLRSKWSESEQVEAKKGITA